MAQRKKSKSNATKPPTVPPRQAPEADAPAPSDDAKAAAEQQLIQAQALSPEVPAGAIGPAELQRQLGEQTAIAGVLRTRLAFAGQIIAEQAAEIQSLKAQIAAADGAGSSA